MRRIADTISDMHLPPRRCKAEPPLVRGSSGLDYVTGNTAVDTLLLTVKDGYVLEILSSMTLISISETYWWRSTDGRTSARMEWARHFVILPGLETTSNTGSVQEPNASEPIRRHLRESRTVLFDPLTIRL